MLSADYRAAKAVMDMHLRQAQQGAALEGLRLQAGGRTQGWLACQAGQGLSRLGRALVGAGQKLERYGLPTVLPADREPQRGSWSASS